LMVPKDKADKHMINLNSTLLSSFFDLVTTRWRQDNPHKFG